VLSQPPCADVASSIELAVGETESDDGVTPARSDDADNRHQQEGSQMMLVIS
jgi:hypothetical protein